MKRFSKFQPHKWTATWWRADAPELCFYGELATGDYGIVVSGIGPAQVDAAHPGPPPTVFTCPVGVMATRRSNGDP